MQKLKRIDHELNSSDFTEPKYMRQKIYALVSICSTLLATILPNF